MTKKRLISAAAIDRAEATLNFITEAISNFERNENATASGGLILLGRIKTHAIEAYCDIQKMTDPDHPSN